ncbi:DNA repair protein RecO [Magnetospirillum moscoviense]|uniref:DNA repair protein RecO n=1 Tax=Magnetospirillum moscoviense TaxID=1437059 RepID=A0A178MXQ9_9PROT|nr:DNA repair protein RecO [Magnetospirillum moscoviense]OAN58046.1 DNA repair protein RecO [Magnetospirillum moscoviense]
MMDWDDDAIVLSARRHGENAAVIHVLTGAHGRHPGLVPGGMGRANRGSLQPGNRVRVAWQGRLAEQLGRFRVELVRADAALHLADPDRLAALSAACAVAEAALPERQPLPAAHAALTALLDALESDAWATVMVHWELALLRALGFGLDLSACAVSGTSEDLAYVSPKSGRAVSRAAGQDWQDRLLELPAFLVAGGIGSAPDVALGLKLTGFFLERHVLAPQRRPMPAARLRLVDRFLSSGTIY